MTKLLSLHQIPLFQKQQPLQRKGTPFPVVSPLQFRGGEVSKQDTFTRQSAPQAVTIIDETDSGQVITQDLTSKFLHQGTIFVYGSVSDGMAYTITQQLLFLASKREADKDNTPITIVINSPGGSIMDGSAILDAMDMVKNTEVNGKNLEIIAVINGKAASMGSVIACNATKCYMTPRSFYMLHNASVGIQGSLPSIHDRLGLSTLLERMMVQLYENKTGYPAEEWLAWLENKERWITAEDAIKLKLCDGITHAFGKMAPPGFSLAVSKPRPEKSITELFPEKKYYNQEPK